MLDKELEQSLNKSFHAANEKRHEFITVEHLLLMLTSNDAASAVLEACGGDVQLLKTKLEIFVDQNTPLLLDDEDRDTQPTMGFQRVLQRALFHVQSSDNGEVSGANVLVAIFSEQDSHAVYLLNKHNIERLDITNYLASGIVKDDYEKNLEAAFKAKSEKDFNYELYKLKGYQLEKQRTLNVELGGKITRLEEVIENLEDKIGGLSKDKKSKSILRSIEFKPEHRQSGLSILNYFSEAVTQKYPDKKISVSIEQNDNTISLCVQTEEGDKEIIEKTLEVYGKHKF